MKNAFCFEGVKDFAYLNDILDHFNYKNWNNFLFFSLNKTYKNLSVLSDIDKRLSDFPFKKLYYYKKKGPTNILGLFIIIVYFFLYLNAFIF